MIFLNTTAISSVSGEWLALAGAMFASVVGYFAGRRNYLKENLQAVTLRLWEEREKSYTQLMKLMARMPLYPSLEEETYWKDLFQVSERLRQWYFNSGGLLMTKDTRDAYMDFQKEVKKKIPDQNQQAYNELLKTTTYTNNKNKTVNGYRYFQELLSAIRTQLTNDLLSRRRGLL